MLQEYKKNRNKEWLINFGMYYFVLMFTNKHNDHPYRVVDKGGAAKL